MKKTLILAIVGLFAFVHSASAQFYVGGSFHINSRLADEKSMYVGFSPDLGYTLGDWCFGSVLELAVQDGSAAFRATPYVEYYFWHSGPVSFFVAVCGAGHFVRHLRPLVRAGAYRPAGV